MTRQGAEQTIAAGALLQGVVYAYRHLTEGTGPAPKGLPAAVEKALGKGEVAPPGTWVVAWGVTWFSISLLSLAAPGFAGSLALLTIVSTILLNGQAISKDVGTRLETEKKGK